MENLYLYSQKKANAGSLPISCWMGSNEQSRPGRERRVEYMLQQPVTQQPATSASDEETEDSANRDNLSGADIELARTSPDIQHLFETGFVHRTTRHLRQE